MPEFWTMMKSPQDLLDDAKDPGADPVAVKAMKTFDLMDKVACNLYLYGIQNVLFQNCRTRMAMWLKMSSWPFLQRLRLPR